MKNKEIFKRVLSYIKPYLIYLVMSFICALFSVISALLIPILVGNAIDALIGEGKVVFAIIEKTIIYILAVGAISSLSGYCLTLSNNKLAFNVSQKLRDDAIKKIQTLPLSYLDAHPTGDLVSRIISDVDTFSAGLLLGLTQLFTGILTIIGTLGFMLSVNLPITIVVVVLTPLSLFVAGFIAKHTYTFFQAQTKVKGDLTAYINEQIDGLKVIQAFGHENRSIKDFDTINDHLKGISLQAVFYSSLTNPSTRLVNNTIYAFVGLVGSLFAINGHISIGQLSVFLSYASSYAKPFNEISSVVTELQNALACISRIFEILDLPSEIKEKETVLECDGHVRLENVYFSYTKDKPLIEDFNLDVLSGKRIAIVGPTGCGKTTLINLLMRFYDVDQGTIMVSDMNIADVTRHSLRKSFGMVLQDTWLKKGTIKENIAYGKKDATDEEIINACKACYADGFIRRLPNGYDTYIGEEGGNLSQGQKQLLCIARVMLMLPPMLILDEATSSIDTRTEIKIQAAFAKLMKGRTSFIVAHRLSTIREADIILVMKDGHIIEQGNHESLMANDGFYKTLYNSQFAGTDE